MANTLTQVGIETGNAVEAYHVTQSIDAFTGTVAYDILLSGSFNMTGSINGQPNIINPLTASHAITASYVAGTIGDLGVSPLTVVVATTAVLPLSPVYNNGPSNNGVGAFLSGSSNGSIGSIDGVTLVLNDRLLVKNQSSQLQNGIYEVTQTGSAVAKYILTRTTDSDETTEFDPQVVIPSLGSTNKGFIFSQQTNEPTVGTNNIVYSQITTNTYVTQTPSPSQVTNSIPYWNNVSRQLSSTSRLSYSSSILTQHSLILTGSLVTSGSRVRNYRTITIPLAGGFSTNPTSILPTDDIILIIDNGSATPLSGEGNLGINSFLSSSVGRCVEIVVINSGGGVWLKNNNSNNLMVNTVSQANGVYSTNLTTVGSSTTIMAMGGTTCSIWGTGV